MWNFKDNKDLVGVAFIDGETYIHRAIALKTFVIVADVSRSIQVLRYKVGNRIWVGPMGGALHCDGHMMCRNISATCHW